MNSIKINFTSHVRKKLKKLGFITNLNGVHRIYSDFRAELPCRMDNALVSELGCYSYISSGFRSASKVKIGRFCSIAENVKITLGQHPIDRISTSPFFYEKNFYGWNAGKTLEPYSYEDSVEIGDDVWIGEGARIMDGLKIGTGAIIACGAVVTKDVPEFAIVGGVPAKLIKERPIQWKFTQNFKPKGILTQEDFEQFLPLRQKIKKLFIKNL